MEKVTFGGDKNLTGYLVGNDGPGIIVLQEWWGITEEIKRQATKISEQGFRCLVPDLYKGSLGVDMEEAHHLMSNLDFPAAVGEIMEAAKFLNQDGSKGVGIGITGFCMGGALTLLSLAEESGTDITCGVPFYGVPEGLDCSTISKPVQGHFGELDGMAGFSDAETAKTLRGELKKGNNESEVFIYPGVGHAFMNDDPQHPNIKAGVNVDTGFPGKSQDVQNQAFKRMVDFFKAKLQ